MLSSELTRVTQQYFMNAYHTGQFAAKRSKTNTRLLIAMQILSKQVYLGICAEVNWSKIGIGWQRTKKK